MNVHNTIYVCSLDKLLRKSNDLEEKTLYYIKYGIKCVMVVNI